MKVFKTEPIIGQQAIVSFGRQKVLGTVVDFEDRFPHGFIRVRHPITGAEQDFAPENAELIPVPRIHSSRE
jgi:hypothetical protein